jgi:succinyl-CoA synthetase beta subunit
MGFRDGSYFILIANRLFSRTLIDGASETMKIHEYQARELLAQAGIPVPAARVVESAAAAQAAFQANGSPVQVLKAQVFAGGRGKAGFVKLVKSPEEARAAAEFMLTHRMVSPQTPPQGCPVKKLLIAAAVEISHEYYLGVAVDRAQGAIGVIASAEGGVEIETVAHQRPSAIIRQMVAPGRGLEPFQARQIAVALGFKGGLIGGFADIQVKLVRFFLEHDAALAEINPLVRTTDGRLLALDAKVNFDDNAVWRHPRIAALKDDSETDPLEIRAAAAGLNYIKLDGQIACVVNGAGLAMATMDVIQLHGGRPANFLDVGGGVTPEGAREAFGIILADPNVRGILVNIFGGIARCDLIAEALVQAGRELGFKVPVVVRLEGTRVREANAVLAAAKKDLPTLRTAQDLNEAGQRIVAAAGA